MDQQWCYHQGLRGALQTILLVLIPTPCLSPPITSSHLPTVHWRKVHLAQQWCWNIISQDPGEREGSVVLASALHWFPPRTPPNHPHYIHCPNATTGHCWTVNLVTRRCLFGGRVIICFFGPAPPGHGRAQEAEFGKCERSVTARWRDHPTLIPLLSHPSMPTCTPTPA